MCPFPVWQIGGTTTCDKNAARWGLQMRRKLVDPPAACVPHIEQAYPGDLHERLRRALHRQRHRRHHRPVRRGVSHRERHHQGRDEPDRHGARQSALQPHGSGDRGVGRLRRQHRRRHRQPRRARRLLRQGIERRARRNLHPRYPRPGRRLRHQAAQWRTADGALDDLRHARRRALDEHLSRRLRRARPRGCRSRQGRRREGHLFRGLSLGSAARQGSHPADRGPRPCGRPRSLDDACRTHFASTATATSSST